MGIKYAFPVILRPRTPVRAAEEASSGNPDKADASYIRDQFSMQACGATRTCGGMLICAATDAFVTLHMTACREEGWTRARTATNTTKKTPRVSEPSKNKGSFSTDGCVRDTWQAPKTTVPYVIGTRYVLKWTRQKQATGHRRIR